MAFLTYFLGAYAHAEYKTVYSLMTPQNESAYILDTNSIKRTPTGAVASLQVGYKDKAVMIGKTSVRYTLQKITVDCALKELSVNSVEYYDINNMFLHRATQGLYTGKPKPNSGQLATVYSICNFDNL